MSLLQRFRVEVTVAFMPSDSELETLRLAVSDLRRRIETIERLTGLGPARRADETDAVARPPLVREEPPPAPPAVAQTPSPSQPAPPPPSMASSGRRSLENMIGGQLLNRIGIAAVLIGVSYFLKLAFENNWIGPAGRVSIGLAAGVVLLFWSERFRSRGYLFFSYSLKIVGIGVLYLSLWASFQLYHLLPSAAAFAGMIVVTASTAVIAIRQNAEILGALALAGGFLTPVLLSTGENHAPILFSYLTLLNAGMLVMVALKPWRRLAALAFLSTFFLYVEWHSSWFTAAQLELAIAFVTGAFLMFSSVALLRSADGPAAEEQPDSPILILLVLFNAGVYFGEMNAILWDIHRDSLPWIAVGLGALYLALSRLAPRTMRGLSQVELALAIGFITIAIPLKLDAQWITLGWLVEAAALLWIGRRRPGLLSGLGTLALGLGIVRLLIFDDFETARVILNARFALYLVACAVLGGIAVTARPARNIANPRNIAILALNLLAFTGLNLEVADFFSQASSGLSPRGLVRDFTYSALWMGYGGVLLAIGFVRRSSFTRWLALFLIGITTAKVFLYDLSELERGYRILSFIGLGILLLGISFVYQRNWLEVDDERTGSQRS